MKPSDLNVPPAAANDSRAAIDTTEVRKVSFWVAQIFVLAATVAGVYLAANQGFRQAIAYEKVVGEKNNYYLRLSLRDELAENVALVKGYMEKIKNGGPAARKEPFQLESFVWQSMKFSSSTLETPPELLTGARAFYRQVGEIQEKVATLSYGVDNANKKLQELVDGVERELLPRFDADIARLRLYLERNGMEM